MWCLCNLFFIDSDRYTITTCVSKLNRTVSSKKWEYATFFEFDYDRVPAKLITTKMAIDTNKKWWENPEVCEFYRSSLDVEIDETRTKSKEWHVQHTQETEFSPNVNSFFLFRQYWLLKIAMSQPFLRAKFYKEWFLISVHTGLWLWRFIGAFITRILVWIMNYLLDSITVDQEGWYGHLLETLSDQHSWNSRWSKIEKGFGIS